MITPSVAGPPELVDSGTLTLIATIVQTVVITLTLLVFIFQFRSQEKALKEASYQNLLGRYNDFMMTAEDTDNVLFARLMGDDVPSDPGDLAIVRRLLLSYGIIEEAYELYKKGWIDDESWEQWNTWLKAISRHPHFVRIHNATQGMYDKEFQDHVTRLIGSSSSVNQAS
jgi:hypothetical protein